MIITVSYNVLYDFNDICRVSSRSTTYNIGVVSMICKGVNVTVVLLPNVLAVLSFSLTLLVHICIIAIISIVYFIVFG